MPATVRYVAAFWMIVAAVVLFASTRHGIGVTPDAGHYLRTADNLLAGRGFVRLGPEIMASWPPLFPVIIAAGQAVGLDALAWIRAANILLLAICVAIAVSWTYARTRSIVAVAAAGGAMALGPPLLYVGSMALTELLFVALVLLAFWQLDAWLETGARRPLVVCTAAVAAACLTRYQGAALAGTVAVVIVLAGSGTAAARLRTAATTFLAAVLPLALWLARNVILTGRPAGPRVASEYALADAVADLGQTVMSWFVPWRVLLTAPYVGILLFTAAVGGALVVSRRTPLRRPVLICVTFATSFALLMIAAATRNAMDPLSDRMLSALYAPVALALIFSAFSAVTAPRPARSSLRPRAITLAGIAAAALVVARLSSASAAQVATSWRQGPGGAAHTNFNTDAWYSSPTLRWTAANLEGKLIYASSPAALYLVTGIDSRPFPRKHARRAPGVPMDRLEDIAATVAEAREAYLVVSARAPSSRNFTIPELASALRVAPVRRFPDGMVFQLRPRDAGNMP